MKRTKSVTSREFQHHFGDMSGSLKPGERLTVTKHGQPLGTFTKAPPVREAPDYLANLEKLGHSIKAGQRFINRICDLS